VGLEVDYKSIGLRVGLEIHFQLDTGRKLFCKCPPKMGDGEGLHIIRRLRPTQSELGQIDPAAYFEFKKGVVIEYIAPPDSTCLVELDEEPPHEMDMESLRAALRVARFFGSDIVDEVHVMRKIVVDGSNTTGFQRTSVVALGGSVYIPDLGRSIGIQSICVEEEAARLIDRRGNKVIYNLDRLGIPLIEIATEPEIYTPDEAVSVALYIGRLVTMTGVRRRGLGSIRQDINISVGGGPVVEVKGVQRLQQLRAVIEFEVKRQLGLRMLADELRDRGVSKELLARAEPVDVTEIFMDIKCKVIRRGLERGAKVYAVCLPGFGGLLGREIAPGHRLGKELAERVRFWTGLGGLFHTDEMPKYGVSQDEVGKLVSRMGASEGDAIVFYVSSEGEARIAAERIVERCMEALEGVPKETRGARDDGTTFYMRPRPGMARMYPETDIPPIVIDDALRKYLADNPLTPPDQLVSNIVSKYGLPEDMAWRLFDEGLHTVFEELIETAPKLKPIFIASFLTDRLPYLMDELGLEEPDPILQLVKDGFKLVEEGVMFKESIPDVVMEAYRESLDIRSVVERLGLKTGVDYGEVKGYLMEQLKNRDDLKALPKNILVKRLMAIAMSKYRGSVDPKRVLDIVESLVGDLD